MSIWSDMIPLMEPTDIEMPNDASTILEEAAAANEFIQKPLSTTATTIGTSHGCSQRSGCVEPGSVIGIILRVPNNPCIHER